MRALVVGPLLLVSWVTAEERPVITFHTDPPGVLVSDQFGDLGSSLEPIPLRTTYANGNIALKFRAPGYRDAQADVSAAYFTTATVYPSEGTLRLHPASPAAYLHYYRTPLLAGGLPLGLAALLYAVSRRKSRAAEELEARLKAPAEKLNPYDLHGMVDRYRLVERLGSGAAATVYKALDVEDPQAEPVAIKVLHENTSAARDFRPRFRREAQLYQQLSHPNIVRMLNWGEQSGLIYLVLEYIDGGTLRARLQRGRLPVAEAAAFLDPLFRAVHYAHQRGIVHRDLKPENILLTARGVIKVTDFGLGRASDSELLTRSDATLGTPAYMAPEQIVGGEFGPSIDQYALGVIAYEMLCGQRPFHADDPVQMIFKQVHELPATPALPPALANPLLRMLAKDPTARFADVEAARCELLAACRT